MAGIDDLSAEVRKRADDAVRQLSGAGTPAVAGFGTGPMLLVAALGTRRQDDAGVVNGTPQPITEKLLDGLGQATGRSAVPIKPEEAKQVLALLRSGEFHNDLAQGIRALLVLVRVAPQGAIETVLQAPSLPIDLIKAVSADVLTSLAEGDVRKLLEDLRDGKIDDPPNFLSNTLRVLLGLATPRAVVETVRSLIAKDNETFRLALIVYARSQGVDLTQADLDALRTALDPDSPNLGVLFDRGLQYIRRRTGGPGEAADIIQRLAFVNPK